MMQLTLLLRPQVLHEGLFRSVASAAQKTLTSFSSQDLQDASVYNGFPERKNGTHGNPQSCKNGGLNSKRVETLGDYIYIIIYMNILGSMRMVLRVASAPYRKNDSHHRGKLGHFALRTTLLSCQVLGATLSG